MCEIPEDIMQVAQDLAWKVREFMAPDRAELIAIALMAAQRAMAGKAGE